ncbi:TcpE family conjugal transfer membrane protein [Nonomuraea sp. NPDC002799]
MDLPTYTNIWRIEKRLYKLYDLRLPMPLPIVWIGVFVGVFVPWSLLLVLVGVPVEMPWHVLFLVPPGIVTWLSTRPVIEGKRLTELLESHLRYLGQPRAWYRLSPTAESETITFSGRVWRTTPARAKSKAPRKSREPQRRREGQRIAGPRQVRPAVAAAAAAAAQAPVAEPAPARWGTRRGAAPALRAQVRQGAPVAGGGPVQREETPSGGSGRRTGAPGAPLTRTPPTEPAEPVAHEQSTPQAATPRAGGAARAGSARVPAAAESATHEPAEMPGRGAAAVAPGREAGEQPGRKDAGRVRDREVARWAQDVPAPEGEREAAGGVKREREAAGGVADEREAAGEAEAGRGTVVPIRAAEGRRAAAGKPIDTEALRRLRRLAASADGPADARDDMPADSTTGAEAEGPRREDEVARNQHRKGQPPRLGPALVLSGTQRVWPPINPDGKPLPRASASSTDRHEAARPDRRGAAGNDRHGASGADRRGAAGVDRHGVSGADQRGADGVDRHDAAGAERQGVDAAEQAGAGGGRKGVAGADRHDAAPAAHNTTADPGDAGTQPPAPAGDVPGRSPAATDTPDRQGAAGGGARVEPGEAGGMVTPVPVPRPGEGRVRRVESVVGRDSGGWRRIAQVVVGGGGVRTDGSEIDEARARGVFGGSRRIVVLGCTGGAGQSTTALMLGHTFAQYRDDRVVAVDANSGGSTLTSKIQPETPETLTSLLSGLDRVSGYLTMRGYTTRTASGLEVISADTDAGAEQRLADRSFFSDHRLGESMRLLDRHYKLAVIDPAAALAARILPYADQLVLVVPASEEASEAVAMTYEWLDGHGCAELRRRAVMVVNGVSRRSMADVEQAESVASGRCRAIVRVPWEDDLAPDGAEVVDPGQLRAAGRRAYLALAGVVVAGFAAQARTVRPSEEELASDPPGTRIGER